MKKLESFFEMKYDIITVIVQLPTPILESFFEMKYDIMEKWKQSKLSLIRIVL